MNKNHYVVRILENKKLCPKFRHLTLSAERIARRALPGQFVHIRIQGGRFPFFRRPFSVFRSKQNLEILYEVVGQGTDMLSKKKKGDTLDIVGPLGNGFTLPGKGTKNVYMIAGGVGVAPFMALADKLSKKNINVHLLYGAQDKAYFFNLDEFKKLGCKIYKASDNGSIGEKGRVSKLFKYINTDTTSVLYACGPRPMIRSVKYYAKKRHLFAQASCEEVMACGTGACLGCAIKTTKGYKTVCNDGPVFNTNELVFDK